MKVYEWLELRQRVPDNYRLVCELCSKLMKLNRRVQSIDYQVAGSDMMSFQSITQRIIGEYLAIIRNAGVEEAILEDVKRDIGTTFSLFLTPKGGIKNLTDDLVKNRASNSMEDFISQLFSPFIAFVDTRIYDSLQETREKTQPIFNTQFVNWSCRKAGIFITMKGAKPVSGKKKQK